MTNRIPSAGKTAAASGRSETSVERVRRLQTTIDRLELLGLPKIEPFRPRSPVDERPPEQPALPNRGRR